MGLRFEGIQRGDADHLNLEALYKVISRPLPCRNGSGSYTICFLGQRDVLLPSETLN